MKGFLTFREAKAVAFALVALAALVSLSCRIPFGIGAKGGISSLSVSIRVPSMPSARASAGSGSRLITAYTTSIAITLAIPGETPIHQEKAPDSDGLVSFSIDAVPANLDITITTEASDASGVYSRNVTTRRFSPGPNALPIVLLPTGAIAMPVGYGAATLDANASAIYQVTATKAGDWTLQFDGSCSDSEAWGPDGKPVAGFVRGANSVTIPGMAIGQSAYLALRANSTSSGLSSHFYRAATGTLDPTFGSAGLAAAIGDGKITDENITDICRIDNDRIAVVGSYKSNPTNDATQRSFFAVFKNGALDTSFNSSGTPGWISFSPSGLRSEACSCAFQANPNDPRIIVAGRYYNSSVYQYFMVRIDLDSGSPFGTDSVFDPAIHDSTWDKCYPPRVITDSSGSIYMSTYNDELSTPTSNMMSVSKIQTDGINLDTNFGVNGVVSIAANRICTSLAIDANNLFIASQSTSNTDFGVTRILASGVKSSVSFGNVALMGGINADSYVVSGVGTNYASGKIVLSSASSMKSVYLTCSRLLPGHSGFKDMSLAVIKYADGTPLYTTGCFDANGVWTASSGITRHFHAFDVVVDASGNMSVFGGNVDFVSGLMIPIHNGGTAIVDRIVNATAPYQDFANSKAIEGAACITSAIPSSDGNIAAGGYATESPTSNDIALYSLSPSTSNTMSRWSKPLSRETCVFNDIAVQRVGSENGYIVAVGTLNGNKGIVACFTPDGKPDLSFNGTGRVVFDNGTDTTTLRAVAVDKNGDIYAAGDLYNGTSRGYLVHLTSSGGLSSVWNTTTISGQATIKAVDVSEDLFLCCGGVLGTQAFIIIYDPLGNAIGSGAWSGGSSYASVDDLVLGKDKTLHATLTDQSGNACYLRASLTDAYGFSGTNSINIIGSISALTCKNAKVVLDDKGTAYTVSNVSGTGDFYPFVRLYDSGMNSPWYRGFTGLRNSDNSSFGIGVHPNGTVFISGNRETTSTEVQSYIAAIDSNGNLLSSNAVPNSNTVLNQCQALTISPSGSIVVAGDVGDTGTNGAVFVFD